MMVDDLFWFTKAGFEGNQSQAFLAISGMTVTGTDPSLAGNSALRLNIIAAQVLPSNRTRNR